jgi:hypothetical protein
MGDQARHVPTSIHLLDDAAESEFSQSHHILPSLDENGATRATSANTAFFSRHG